MTRRSQQLTLGGKAFKAEGQRFGVFKGQRKASAAGNIKGRTVSKARKLGMANLAGPGKATGREFGFYSKVMEARFSRWQDLLCALKAHSGSGGGENEPQGAGRVDRRPARRLDQYSRSEMHQTQGWEAEEMETLHGLGICS